MKGASSGGVSTVKRREFAVGSDADYAGDAVDVPRHDMPAQLVAGLERTLEVDALARPPVAQRGLAQRFVGDVDLEQAAAPRRATSVAVRQAPSQAIEAPMAMLCAA